MMDLFAHADRYPHVPSFKARETSASAAEAMRPKASRLKQLCLDAVAQHGSLTADECADKLQIDRLAIRPRFSELAATHQIVDTGERRKNDSQRRAIVWALPLYQMAA